MTFYRKAIIKDVTRVKPYNRSLRFFSGVFYSFLALQLATYFYYFHNKVLPNFKFIQSTHTKMVFTWDPRLIVVAYDQLLIFLVFMFINIIFLGFFFVHFDITQRNKIICELIKENKCENA